MTFNTWRRRGALFSVLALVVVMATSACSRDDSKNPTPRPPSTEQTSATPEPATKPKVCELDIINAEACDAAIAVEKALRAGVIDGFDIDPLAKQAFDLVLVREEELRVTAIGCPFAATALGCGPSFGVAVSSARPGTDASDGRSITYALAFIRDAACDASVIYTGDVPANGVSSLCKPEGAAGTPLLSEVKFVTETGLLNALVNGGLAQGGTLAGRPKGITDTHVRSEWYPFPDEPQTIVPDVVKGVATRKLTIGNSVPVDRLLFIATGCWGCDGPTSGLDRVYRLGGQVVREEMDLPGGGIRSIAVRPNTQEIILVTCQQDHCGDFGPAQTGLVATVYRSLDGGVSWEAMATLDDYVSVDHFTPDGYLVTVWSPAADLVNGTYSYYLMPGLREVKKPAGTAEYGQPRVLLDGTVTFQSEDGKRWLREDGSVAYQLPFDVDGSNVNVWDIPGGSHLISWSMDLGPGKRAGYQVLWRNGAAQFAYVDAGNGISWRVGHWLSDAKFIGNVFVSEKQLGLANSNMYDYEQSRPAYVDLDAGVVNPIDTPFFQANYRMNRTYVMGSKPGEFARVNTPADCLHLREMASTASPSLGCMKHGTLVAEDPFVGSGPGWVRVIGPLGQLGYVAAEFLER